MRKSASLAGLRVTLAAFAALLFGVAPLRAAAVYDWGSEYFSTLLDSKGNALDALYTFELGAFDPSFTPSATNVTSWAANWKIFDATTINITNDVFRSSAYLLEDGTSSSTNATAGYSFLGLEAYVWGYNTTNYGEGMEWVWLRSELWTFLTNVTPGPPVTPIDWSISQLATNDVPLWGAQSNIIGLGYASAPTSTNNLQTYTIVPEPSTTLLLALGLVLIALWCRRRKMARSAASSVLLAAALGALVPAAQANRINFYSTPGQPAYATDGRPLDPDMAFELGVFTGGFVPTAINTAEWSAHWVPAQRTKFSSKHSWFTSVFNVTGNEAPFTAGAPAYVWGFSGSEAQGQWILFRSAKWTWPVADPTAPQPLFWSAKDADVVVVGALPAAGTAGVGLRPTTISNSLPPVTTWGQFQADKMSGVLLGNPGDDADGDGISNILEFALGTAPDNAADRPASPATWSRLGRGTDGKSYLEVRVPRRRDRAVNFTAELTADLAKWSSGTNVADTVENTVEALTLRDKTPIGEGGTQRFMRVKASAQ